MISPETQQMLNDTKIHHTVKLNALCEFIEEVNRRIEANPLQASNPLLFFEVALYLGAQYQKAYDDLCELEKKLA